MLLMMTATVKMKDQSDNAAVPSRHHGAHSHGFDVNGKVVYGGP